MQKQIKFSSCRVGQPFSVGLVSNTSIREFAVHRTTQVILHQRQFNSGSNSIESLTRCQAVIKASCIRSLNNRKRILCLGDVSQNEKAKQNKVRIKVTQFVVVSRLNSYELIIYSFRQ